MATATKAVWGILACVYIAGCVLILSTLLQQNKNNKYIHTYQHQEEGTRDAREIPRAERRKKMWRVKHLLHLGLQHLSHKILHQYLNITSDKKCMIHQVKTMTGNSGK